jgi:hypothetical protein
MSSAHEPCFWCNSLLWYGRQAAAPEPTESIVAWFGITVCRHFARNTTGVRHPWKGYVRNINGFNVEDHGDVRLLGRYVDNYYTPTIPVKPSPWEQYNLLELLKRLDLVEGAVIYDNGLVVCTISEHPWQRSAPYTLLWCKIFCMLRRYSCLTF